MPAIANCPECDRQVSIPQGADPAIRVRCPLCEAEYELEQALRTAPPELIVLDAHQPAAAAAEAGALTAGEGTGDADPFGGWVAAGSEATLDVRVEPPTSDDGELELEMDASPEAATDRDAESSGIGAGFQFGGGEVHEATLDDAESEGGSSSNIFGGNAFSPGAEVAVPSMAPVPGRRRRKSSVLRMMIGVFGGGAVGLGLGYYLLLWIGGPPKDFLKVGQQLPAFMVPAAFHPEAISAAPAPSGGDDGGGRSLADLMPDGGAGGISDGGASDGGAADGGASDAGLDGGTETPFGDPLASTDGTDAGDLAPFDDPFPSEPEAPPEPPVRGATLSTPSDLGKALGTIVNVEEALRTGSLTEPDTKRAKLQAYRAFCTLAEVVTFVQPEPGKDQLSHRRRAIRDILGKISQSALARNDIGRLSRSWLSASSRDTAGALLVGSVEEVQEEGAHHVMRMRLSGLEDTVTVISDRPLGFAADDKVVVLGSIVEDAPADVVDYEGTAARAIWSGMTVKVQEDDEF